MNEKKVLIIIPTFNEIENIGNMIREISSIDQPIDILIVDDNSPDGTGAQIKDLQKTFSNLHLLEREGKLGLGTAYVAGFKFALQNGYDFIFEMDAARTRNSYSWFENNWISITGGFFSGPILFISLLPNLTITGNLALRTNIVSGCDSPY